MKVETLITEHLDTWTGTLQQRNATGRGSSKKTELYGIKKLRELILELAVRGRLVPQDSADEPAAVLLERIAVEKARLVAEGKIKKPKVLPEITEGEKPFELPVGWVWCRLGSLFNSIISGGTPSKREPRFWGGNIPWASVKDLGKQRVICETQDYITEEGLKAGSKLASSGDLLICTRMGLGKIAIAGTSVAFNQDLKAVALSSGINREFFLMAYSTLKIEGTGTTVAGITQEQLLNYIAALPPEAEQTRIVTKVNELMQLCDQLEQATENNLAAHETLVSCLLDTLTQSQNAADLANNWSILSQHFDTLFTTESSIDQLKQTILQLAVMGKLVAQDPNNEPAEVLLARIAAEKARLVKERKIKKQKVLPEITEEEKSFDLPEGWAWCRLGRVIELISGQHLTPNEYVETGGQEMIPYVSGPADFGLINPIPMRFTNTRKAVAKNGDILLTVKGSGVGKLNIANQAELAIGRQVMAVRVNEISDEFLYIWMQNHAKYFQLNKTGIAIPGISRDDVLNAMLCLPPLKLQPRIVAKVNELMQLCDQLKTNLTQAQQTQLKLTNTLVDQAL